MHWSTLVALDLLLVALSLMVLGIGVYFWVSSRQKMRLNAHWDEQIRQRKLKHVAEDALSPLNALYDKDPEYIDSEVTVPDQTVPGVVPPELDNERHNGAIVTPAVDANPYEFSPFNPEL